MALAKTFDCKHATSFELGSEECKNRDALYFLREATTFKIQQRLMAMKMTMYGMCCVAICGMRYKTIEVWGFDLAGSF